MVNLEKLVLSRNQIISIPESIGNLKKLESLSLKANKIEELPSSIGQLQALEVLRLCFNKLKFLPDQICELESLSQLYVEYNNLVALPDSLGKLNLTDLFVNWNKLSALPFTFYNLSKLSRLNLTNAGPGFKLTDKICSMWRLEQLYIDQNTLNFGPRCLEIRARSNPRFTIFLEN